MGSDSLTLTRMSRSLQLRRLNLMALAQSGQDLAGQMPLHDLPRLAADVPPEGPATDPIAWQANPKLRTQPDGTDQLWLHLQAQAQVPLVCQRCLAPVVQGLEVDRWFRFVDTEAAAEAEDDGCEEDLLVMDPHFDLVALLEDELLMTLPLVPMHGQCPSEPVFQAGEADIPQARPNPFGALAQLKKKQV
jgi:uncharacterized protein